jgi:hypothetical protein
MGWGSNGKRCWRCWYENHMFESPDMGAWFCRDLSVTEKSKQQQTQPQVFRLRLSR